MDLTHDIKNCSILLIHPAGNTNFWTNEKADGFHAMLHTWQIKLLVVTTKVLNPQNWKVSLLTKVHCNAPEFQKITDELRSPQMADEIPHI